MVIQATEMAIAMAAIFSWRCGLFKWLGISSKWYSVAEYSVKLPAKIHQILRIDHRSFRCGRYAAPPEAVQLNNQGIPVEVVETTPGRENRGDMLGMGTYVGYHGQSWDIFNNISSFDKR